MKELKFRVWIKDEERYYDESDEESYTIVPNGNVTYTSEAYEEDGVWFTDTTSATNDVIVEQYTGLKDKNGKPIYERDIVKVKQLKRLYVVTYRLYDASFILENDEWEEIIHLSLDKDDFEVVGNIHENPELLEGEG